MACTPDARTAATAILFLGLFASPILRAQPVDTGPRYWFLDSLSPADLTATDWELLRQNIHLALYELKDGESVAWSDPATDHSGSIRVLRSTGTPERTCRVLRVSVDADAGSDDGDFALCRSPGGFWTLQPATAAPQSPAP
jgi:hypothetical protein